MLNQISHPGTPQEGNHNYSTGCRSRSWPQRKWFTKQNVALLFAHAYGFQDHLPLDHDDPLVVTPPFSIRKLCRETWNKDKNTMHRLEIQWQFKRKKNHKFQHTHLFDPKYMRSAKVEWVERSIYQLLVCFFFFCLFAFLPASLPFSLSFFIRLLLKYSKIFRSWGIFFPFMVHHFTMCCLTWGKKN